MVSARSLAPGSNPASGGVRHTRCSRVRYNLRFEPFHGSQCRNEVVPDTGTDTCGLSSSDFPNFISLFEKQSKNCCPLCIIASLVQVHVPSPCEEGLPAPPVSSVADPRTPSDCLGEELAQLLPESAAHYTSAQVGTAQCRLTYPGSFLSRVLRSRPPCQCEP
jgi:hypothetical protein